jgi:two-component system, OmpR family, sensor histidine kinase KdpD
VVYAAAHDLRGPLVTIGGLTTDCPESAAVEAAVSRLDAMLNGLGRLADLGLAEEAAEAVDMAETFALAAERYEVPLKADDGPLMAWGVPSQLARLAEELAINAATHAPAASARLEVRSNTPELLLLRFSDDGPGCPTEERERLFEPFRQVGRPGGSGVGLTIARRIAQLNAGAVELGPGPGWEVLVALRPGPPA